MGGFQISAFGMGVVEVSHAAYSCDGWMDGEALRNTVRMPWMARWGVPASEKPTEES